jgi:hypothetical protein
MAARDAVALLAYLFDEWMKRQQLLRNVGVEVDDLDPIEILARVAATADDGDTDAPEVEIDPSARYAQVAAFAAASGGEVVDG